MKRDTLLTAIRVAAYNGDDKSAIRIYVENRISKKSFDKAFSEGIKARNKESNGGI